jgi:regulator of sigma E protease
MTAVYSILIFCLLIFVHEFGHLAAAKSTGIRVNEFSLGMGPLIFKFQKGDTQYSLRLIPVGGFCAMEGEDEESADPAAFHNRPFYAKVLTVAAGSLMNLFLAFIVLSAVIFSIGAPSTVIASVSEDSPAAEAGIREGDRIMSVNGERIENWDDVLSALRGGGETASGNSGSAEEVTGRPADRIVTMQVERNGAMVEIESGLYTAEDGVQKIGVMPEMERHMENIGSTLVRGVRAVREMGTEMLEVIGKLFSGEVPVTDLTGPVGIVYAVNDTAKIGLIYVAQLTALLSLNLAIVNMLPIPALDGGRLLFLVIRRITGKAITDKLERRIHFAGIMLLFGLMIFVTVHDITRFIL